MKVYKYFVAAMLMVLTAVPAMAQDNGEARKEKFDVAELYNKNANRMAKQMKLEDTEKDKFVALYIEYQTARNGSQEFGKKNDSEKSESREMTDEKAKKLIEKNFSDRERQLKVDKEYYPKFAEFLTAKQLMPVFMTGGGMRPDRNRQGQRNGNGGPDMGPGGFPGGGFPGGGPGF